MTTVQKKKMNKIFITLLLITLALSSCSNKDPRDFLINKWRITDVTPTTPYSESLKKATLEFKKDGTWSLTGTPAPDQAGMYTLSDDYKTLTTTDVHGLSTPCEVFELSKQQLIFTDSKLGLKIHAVPR